MCTLLCSTGFQLHRVGMSENAALAMHCHWTVGVRISEWVIFPRDISAAVESAVKPDSPALRRHHLLTAPTDSKLEMDHMWNKVYIWSQSVLLWATLSVFNKPLNQFKVNNGLTSCSMHFGRSWSETLFVKPDQKRGPHRSAPQRWMIAHVLRPMKANQRK